MNYRYGTRCITIVACAALWLTAWGFQAPAAALFQEPEAEEEVLTQEEYDAHVEQSNAYMAAIEEADPLKRGDMLLGFLEKYPESSLVESHIKPAYTVLMAECYQNEKFEELETLAEKWLAIYPDNRQTISFAATAAAKLEHNEKYLQYLLVLYEMEPTAGGARMIAELYDQQGDFDKFLEWSNVAFTYPEYSVDYTLRYKILTKYADAGDVAKATDYAHKTLEVLDSAPKPDAAGQKAMQTIRRECNHIIAVHHYEEQNYSEAIKYFDCALKAERFQDGLYYIAQCYWRLGDPEKAHDYFAAAEMLGGNLTEKSKDYKEDLYKTLHNNTLIGIEKVHKRAQEILDTYSAAGQKETELAEI